METVSLNGRWVVKQIEEVNAEWLAAAVPGCIHTDLLAADGEYARMYHEFLREG